MCLLSPRRFHGGQGGDGCSCGGREGGGCGEGGGGRELPVFVEGEACQIQGRARQGRVGLLGARRLEALIAQCSQASPPPQGGSSCWRVRPSYHPISSLPLSF